MPSQLLSFKKVLTVKPVSASLVFLVLLSFVVINVVTADEALADSSPNTEGKKEVNFSLLVFNGNQRSAYLETLDAFEREHPDIEVNFLAVESEEYKDNIEEWLQAESYSDVMFWFGGERLNWYIKQGWVKPVTDLWARKGWDERITMSAKSAVVRQDQLFALPIHYYHWGIYYRKSLFENFEITPPTNWNEFIQVCQTLQGAGITPIALGSKEHWPLAGWFDYLNLRVNGLEFHKQLLSGEASYRDPRVEKALEYMRVLISNNYFLSSHADQTWRDALPFLYRKRAGMFLMGNFWTSQIPESVRDDIGVMSFPTIFPDIGKFEEAPTDVLFIPSNVKNLETAEILMDYMARPDVQAKLNAKLGMLAPQVSSPQTMDSFLTEGQKILGEAEGISQFYDRDNPQPIATKGMVQFSRFVRNPDALPAVIDELESLRRQSFAK